MFEAYNIMHADLRLYRRKSIILIMGYNQYLNVRTLLMHISKLETLIITRMNLKKLVLGGYFLINKWAYTFIFSIYSIY